MGGQNNYYLNNAINYTLKKYSAVFPLTFIAVMISMIVRHLLSNIDLNLIVIIKAVLEALMIIRGDSNVGVLWYMSAMLPVLPIMGILIQKFSSKVYGILSLIVVIIWYFILKRFDDVFFPLSYFRAVAGLSLGILVFLLKETMNITLRRSRLSGVARATIPDKQSHLITNYCTMF